MLNLFSALGQTHPWVSFAIASGFGQSNEESSAAFANDAYPYSFETEYRFKALGHTQGQWSTPIQVNLSRTLLLAHVSDYKLINQSGFDQARVLAMCR